MCYCTYKKEPDSTVTFMEPEKVRSLARLAKKQGCTEALIVAGERPEEKYSIARRWLDENGFASTPDYAAFCSQIALERGDFCTYERWQSRVQRDAQIKKYKSKHRIDA